MPRSDQSVRSAPWYAQGLRFRCTQCGNCCTGPTGFVWFDMDELTAMAEHVGLPATTFLRRHARKIDGRWSLNERQVNGQYDCVFLQRDDEGKALCTIYPVRPAQCRTWPFWPENLETADDWFDAAKTCPGIRTGLEGGGDFIPLKHIRIQRDRTPS